MTAASRPWLAAAIVWTLAILAVNSISVPHSAWQPPFAGVDKLTHAALYGAAAYAWRRAIRARGAGGSWFIVLGIALVGAFDEWHQRSVLGRSADVFDWMADVIGACLGVLAWRRLHAPPDARL